MAERVTQKARPEFTAGSDSLAVRVSTVRAGPEISISVGPRGWQATSVELSMPEVRRLQKWLRENCGEDMV